MHVHIFPMPTLIDLHLSLQYLHQHDVFLSEGKQSINSKSLDCNQNEKNLISITSSLEIFSNANQH